MFERILVAFDGSPSAEKALDAAVELARRFGSSISLVSVMALSEYSFKDDLRNIQEEEHASYERMQRQAIASRDADVEIRPVIISGSPPDEILNYARSQNVNLIVTGRRGLSATERIFIGSVSDKICHFSHCPVLVVT